MLQQIMLSTALIGQFVCLAAPVWAGHTVSDDASFSSVAKAADALNSAEMKETDVPEDARAIASEWNDLVIPQILRAANGRARSTTEVRCQTAGNAGFDGIEFKFTIPDFGICRCKQSRTHILILLPRPANSSGSSNAELAKLVSEKSSCLSGFVLREFSFDSTQNSVSLFRVTRLHDSRACDWRDDVVAICNDDALGYAFPKRLIWTTAIAADNDAREWFSRLKGSGVDDNRADAMKVSDALVTSSFGEVGAALLTMKFKDGDGHNSAVVESKRWDEYFLGTKLGGLKRTTRISSSADGDFDAVENTYEARGQQFLTRQTRYIWTLKIDGSKHASEADIKLGQSLTVLARDLFEPPFVYRDFRATTVEGARRIFEVDYYDNLMNKDYRTSDWRDSVWGVMEDSTISFITLKKKFGMTVLIDGKSNREWFERR
jgi:hypothetical protein